MGISQQQYWQSRNSSALRKIAAERPKKIHLTSTLRDRTPVPQEKPLDEGQFIWGKPSSFSWGSKANEKEDGPYVNSSWDFSWPPYDLGLDEDPDDTDDEKAALPPLVYDWNEVARAERTVRVTGSNGAYVDVKRMDAVVFKLPLSADGREVFVVMRFKKV